MNTIYFKEKDSMLRLKLAKRYFIFFIVFFLGFLNSSFGQQIKSAIDSTTVKIGEELKLKLSVEVAPTDNVVFPESKVLGLLEVIESYRIDTLKTKSKYILNKEYGLIQFDSGQYTIPSQKILVNNKPFFTDSLLVEVRDVLVDTTQQNLYDIKPIIEVEKPSDGFPSWIVYFLLGLVLLIVILYFIFFRKTKKDKELDIKLPPFEEAIQNLVILDSENLLETKEYKKYYSELTDVLKKYLDEKVYSNALESTSDELILQLDLLRDSGQLPISRESIQNLAKVLRTSDLVKFAKSQPDVVSAKLDRDTIENMLRETKEAIPEPTEEELLQDEAYRFEQKSKQKRKKIIYASITGVCVVFFVFIGLGLNYGFSVLKDEIFGHPTKELLEGKWIRSAYGDPSIVITTPVVLKRVSNQQLEALNTQSFAYGSITSNFSIVLNTTRLPESQLPDVNSAENEDEKSNVDLEQVNEITLQNITNQGATNLIVKQEEYSGNGFTGMKAFGSLNIKNPITSRIVTADYEIITFQQGSSLQQIIVFYQQDDKYAEQIVKKVIDSIELKKVEE